MEEIWARTIDTEASARAWRKLGMYGGIPAAIAMVIALIFGGVGAFLGVLILAAIVLGLFAGWIFIHQLGKRMNPTVSLDGSDIVWARRRISTSDIVLWSTYQSKATVWMNGDESSAPIGAIRFRLRDESETDFQWPNLPDEELEGLKSAVARHVTAPWVPVDSWTETIMNQKV